MKLEKILDVFEFIKYTRLSNSPCVEIMLSAKGTKIFSMLVFSTFQNEEI